MPGIDRTTIIQGPCRILFGGEKFWSKGDVTVKPVPKRFAIESANFGKLEERNIDLRLEITFEPAGQFTDEIAAVLWPYASMLPGTSIFGSTDDALVINGIDGTKLTVHNAAVTEMPALRFGVQATTIGQVKITGLIKKDTDPSNAAAYATWASEAYPGETGFSVAQIWTAAAAAGWGSSTFATLHTERGWEITFPLRLSEITADSFGTVDMRLIGVDCMIGATVVGALASDLMAAVQGATAFGARPATNDFAIGGGGAGSPVFGATARIVEADFGWGTGRKRVGRVQWMAVRSFNAYDAGPPVVEVSPKPLWTLAEALA